MCCDKKQSKKERAHFDPQFKMVKDCEATGHIACAFRKGGVINSRVQFILCFLFSPGPQFMEWCHSHLGWVSPALLPNLDISSQACLDVCSLDDSKYF